MFADVGQKLSHHAELMVARENLSQLFPPGFGGFDLNDLSVVFQNVRQTGGRENFLPQIIGFYPRGVGWITRAIIPALVEW